MSNLFIFLKLLVKSSKKIKNVCQGERKPPWIFYNFYACILILINFQSRLKILQIAFSTFHFCTHHTISLKIKNVAIGAPHDPSYYSDMVLWWAGSGTWWFLMVAGLLVRRYLFFIYLIFCDEIPPISPIFYYLVTKNFLEFIMSV